MARSNFQRMKTRKRCTNIPKFCFAERMIRCDVRLRRIKRVVEENVIDFSAYDFKPFNMRR